MLYRDQYKYDFIHYRRLEIDWLAFLIIQLSVNMTIIYLENHRTVDHEKKNPTYIKMETMMIILLVMHFLQFIFIRNLYDIDRKIKMKHVWIWVLHLVAYIFVGYFYFTEGHKAEVHEARKVWIPMDFMLSVFVGIFFMF